MSGNGAASGRPRGDRDRGAATVFAAIVSMGLLVVLWGGVQLGAATLTRHRAEGAADLAALAVAAYAPQGAESACGRAERVVDRMRAVLVSCRLDGWDARVRVRMGLPGLLSGFDPVGARARAGPVPA